MFKKHIVSLFVLVTLLSSLAGAAQAALLCRADPLVVLSNGVVIDFGASISTLPTEVTVVNYELHIPVGVTVVSSVHTPTWLTSQETFTIYADQEANHYEVSVTVYTTQGDADVVADVTLLSALGLRLDMDQLAGKEGEVLTISLSY
jgi:hypothetical protein